MRIEKEALLRKAVKTKYNPDSGKSSVVDSRKFRNKQSEHSTVHRLVTLRFDAHAFGRLRFLNPILITGKENKRENITN